MALLSCLALGACAAALDLARPAPPRLYELTPRNAFATGLPKVDARLAVEVPTATAGLNVARIALRPSPATLEYFAGASWIDVVPVMVQNLLTQIARQRRPARRARPRGGRGAGRLRAAQPRARVPGRVPGAGVAPQIRVRVQARLVRLPRRDSLAATPEEVVVQAAGPSLPAIVEAFDAAFGEAAARLVELTIEQAAAATIAGS